MQVISKRGDHYIFMAIPQDSKVLASRVYDIRPPADAQIISHRINATLETAKSGAPHTTLTKPSCRQDEEIEDYENVIWNKEYKSRNVGFGPAPDGSFATGAPGEEVLVMDGNVMQM